MMELFTSVVRITDVTTYDIDLTKVKVEKRATIVRENKEWHPTEIIFNPRDPSIVLYNDWDASEGGQ